MVVVEPFDCSDSGNVGGERSGGELCVPASRRPPRCCRAGRLMQRCKACFAAGAVDAGPAGKRRGVRTCRRCLTACAAHGCVCAARNDKVCRSVHAQRQLSAASATCTTLTARTTSNHAGADCAHAMNPDAVASTAQSSRCCRNCVVRVTGSHAASARCALPS